MTYSSPTNLGANPTNIQWDVVRGDTSLIKIEFLTDDETQFVDTSTWTYLASAYDPRTDEIDELTVNAQDGYVEIIAAKETTALWGTAYSKVVAELSFDLQVTIAGSTVWTPVIGTIRVLGDITGGSL